MKNQKRTTNRQILSLLLALLMLFFCFPVTALGSDELEEPVSDVPQNTQPESNVVEDEFFGEEEEFVPWELELEEGDLNLVELKTAELSPSETPEIISAALIEEKGHVNRLYEQEPDVFTIMFQNRDGGKTTYVFSHPVKTVSPSGSYTDMTASQIQAIVNSASASTNATAGMSGSLSITASGNKMQINLGSDFIKSRLGNPDAEKPIMSYNIGEFVIFKAGASTLTSGIATATYDVTAEAREWATPGSQLPKFTFTPETDDTQIEADDNVSLGGSIGIITPIVEEEIVVMAVTYSLTAGQYSMRSTTDNTYLKCTTSEILSVSSSLTSPECKWHFQYLSNGRYYIKPMARQNMFLSCYEDILCLLPQADNEDDPQPTMWTLNLQGSSTGTVSGYIYTIDDMYISSGLNMVPGVEEDISMWQLGNADDAELLTSITINNIMVSPGESVNVPVITKSPEITAYTSNDEYFEWISLDSEDIYYDVDNGFCVDETYGVYRIYCRYRFNPEIVSNTAVVIVSDDYDITSGAVYLIRPYEANITANTKLLTMNVGSSSNTLSLSGWATDWNTLSQAFTITQVGDKYRISAIMSTSQYNGGTTYINKHTVSNTLYVTTSGTLGLKQSDSGSTSGVPNDNDLSQLWYIRDIGTSIVFVSAYNTRYALSYANTANGEQTLTLYNQSSTVLWSATKIGVDAPCIRQSTSYYCAAASTLHGLYAYGYYTSGNWAQQQAEIWSLMEKDENNNPVNSSIGKAWKHYVPSFKYMFSWYYSFDDTEDLMYYVSRSLNFGFSPVVRCDSTGIKLLPYCGTSYPYGGHYISVIAYDSYSGKVVVADCNWFADYYGLHIISDNDLFAAFNEITCCSNYS